MEFTTSPSTLTLTEETPAFCCCTRTARSSWAPPNTRPRLTSPITDLTESCCFFRQETRWTCTWKPGPGSGQTATATSAPSLASCSTARPATSPTAFCSFTRANWTNWAHTHSNQAKIKSILCNTLLCFKVIWINCYLQSCLFVVVVFTVSLDDWNLALSHDFSQRCYSHVFMLTF